MTSLITSVSDSLQICLLLFACCHSGSQPVNQSTSQSGNFLLGVRQPAALLLITVAGGIGGEGGGERGERKRRVVEGAEEGTSVQMSTFMQTHSVSYTHTHTHTCSRSSSRHLF